MRFSQMVSLFYAKFRENSTNSTFSEEKVKGWINEGYRYVTNYCLWDFLLKESMAVNVFTACSNGGTSTGTTLYVDSCDYMQTGMNLWVTDGSSYEQVEIFSFNASTNTVTLKSPGLLNEYSDGDTITSADVFIPGDCRKLLDVKLLSLQDTPMQGTTLKACDLRDLDILYPHRSALSKPEYYARGGMNLTTEAVVGAYVAETATNASRIVCSSLVGSNNTYYDGWKVINTTRNCVSYITSYESTGKILDISPVIYGQDSGDNFYLVRDLEKLILFPLPDNQYRVIFRYYRSCSDLSLDSDIPVLGAAGDNYHDLPVDYALAEAFLVDRNLEVSSDLREKFFSRLDAFKQEQSLNVDRLINFKQPGRQSLPGFYL